MEQKKPQHLPADPVISIEGRDYMADAKGALVPLASIRAQDKLQDQTVRMMIGFARDISEQIARFKGHCFADLGTFLEMLAEKYGAKAGGAKGNVTLSTFDGCFKVQLQVADQIDFGPELQAAKQLVDSCISEWAQDSRDELRVLVNRAFEVDREGKINKASLFMLLRAEIADPRWKAAMDAVKDSIRITGTKNYFRFYERPSPEAPWKAITIDLAAA